MLKVALELLDLKEVPDRQDLQELLDLPVQIAQWLDQPDLPDQKEALVQKEVLDLQVPLDRLELPDQLLFIQILHQVNYQH